MVGLGRLELPTLLDRPPPPHGKAQSALGGVGQQIMKTKPQPPRILIKPGSGVYIKKAKFPNSTNYLERN